MIVYWCYDSLLVLLDTVRLYRVYRWLDTLPLYLYYELLVIAVNEKYNAFPVRTASKKLCVDDNDQNLIDPVTVTCNAINQMPYHSNTQFNNGTVTTHFLVHSALYR